MSTRRTPERPAADDRRRLAQSLALSAWDVARVGKAREPGPKGRVISLRTGQRLRNIIEAEQGIAQEHRSIVQVKSGTGPGCLMIHGAGASPAVFRDLAAQLHRDGMNIYVPRLQGHGVGDDSASVMWRACLNQVLARLQDLRRTSSQIYLVGHGFGAALALHVARRESVSGVVLLSPALIPMVPMWQRLLLRLGLRRLPWLRRKMKWNLEMLEAMEKARGNISRLECPLYGAQCDDDDAISPASLRVVQKKARHGASRFRVFPDGGHDVLAAHGRDGLNHEIRDFFRNK